MSAPSASTTELEFTTHLNPSPASADQRAKVLADPGFGVHFTDHMVTIDWDAERGWHDAQVVPYGPIPLDPAASVLHYAQEIFEGLKAYRHEDGSVWTFRPEENAKRFQLSSKRLALPELPVDLFVESLKQLVSVDKDWVPDGVGETSLYLRPFMIATEVFLGVRAAQAVKFLVIASPAGARSTLSGWASTSPGNAPRFFGLPATTFAPCAVR